MREIKFRGMSINGAWHYGSLCILKEKNGLTQPGCYISNSVGMPFAYQVRPESVGQFTGLHDKNGKEIYEGDVLCWPFYEGTKNETRWVVEWNEKEARWSNWSPINEAEIIGNIYENPELIKSNTHEKNK